MLYLIWFTSFIWGPVRTRFTSGAFPVRSGLRLASFTGAPTHDGFVPEAFRWTGRIPRMWNNVLVGGTPVTTAAATATATTTTMTTASTTTATTTTTTTSTTATTTTTTTTAATTARTDVSLSGVWIHSNCSWACITACQ
jgi:hypothetical protein